MEAPKLNLVEMFQRSTFSQVCEEAPILISIYCTGFLYLLHLSQLSPCVLVVPQVLLVPHQDDGNIGTEVLHLGRPLLRDVFCPGRDTRSKLKCSRERYLGQAVQSRRAGLFS